MKMLDLVQNAVAKHIDQHRVEVELERKLIHLYGVTLPQVTILLAIQENRQTIGTIADTHGMNRANLTGLLDRLEKQGLAERERSKDDRRVVFPRLTEKGEAVLRGLSDIDVDGSAA